MSIVNNVYGRVLEAMQKRRLAGATQRMHDNAIIGEDLEIEENAFIQNEAGNPSAINIGSRFRICNGSISCKEGASVSIGSYCVLQDFASINCALEINIGDFVGMAAGSTITDNNTHALGVDNWIRHRLTVAPGGKGYPGLGNGWELSEKAQTTIGDGVWIGSNATILKGVTLGDGVVVASNSVVTKSVAPFTIVAGNPAKVVKELVPPSESVAEIAVRMMKELNCDASWIESYISKSKVSPQD